jgi:glutamate carboxypeptidase
VDTVERPRLVASDELAAIRARVEAAHDRFVGDLATLVGIDCGSYTKAGVDAVGRWTASFLEALGARVEVVPDDRLGDTVVGLFAGSSEGPSVVLIGHMDTVFDPGTVAERPFRVDGTRAYGPGVTDMKAGLLAGLYALHALRDVAPDADEAWLPVGRLVFVANPDEEIGSPVSTPVIRRRAAESDVALVLECARANGDIVSSRKGVADLLLTVTGRAAHAGVEPEKGRSAILEAAQKTVALHALSGRWPGVTCNVGVVRGGTRPNVVAAACHLEVDLRATTRETMEAAEAEMRAICERSSVPDVTCAVEERHRHWPMEKLERSARLVDHAVGLAAALGFPLKDAATGGASDANTTAGMAVPTIDGLGPVGGNDHSPAEYLELDSIVPRVSLLAGLLLAIGRDETIASWRAERVARHATGRQPE